MENHIENIKKAVERVKEDLRHIHMTDRVGSAFRNLDHVDYGIYQLENNALLKHQLGVMTNTEDKDFNELVDIVCDRLMQYDGKSTFVGEKMQKAAEMMLGRKEAIIDQVMESIKPYLRDDVAYWKAKQEVEVREQISNLFKA